MRGTTEKSKRCGGIEGRGERVHRGGEGRFQWRLQ